MTESTDETRSDYRLIGAEESPYSVKVRACLRYKALPHQWLSRNEAGDLYHSHARLPLVPLLITPDYIGLQDSTPILEALEESHPEPSIHPRDPTCRFLSYLLEEFADEWANKWMFHYRWARPRDQLACSKRLAVLAAPDADEITLQRMATTIRDRMMDRVWFVGSSPQTAQQIEASFKDAIALLEPHLAMRPYLFGGRPAFADFALWGQLYNAFRDPTPNEILTAQAPNVVAWIQRMKHPSAIGEFEQWNSLGRTLLPLLIDQVGTLFLPWSEANALAIEASADTLSVRLRDAMWTQRPQKYQASSRRALRSHYQVFQDDEPLRAVLEASGCLEFLI